tara:strand:+ start:375 stop:596 length:222 start_codon:yes stop_codon:yes gene_type:complete
MGIKVVSTGKYPNPNRAAKKGEQDNPHRKKKPKKKERSVSQKALDRAAKEMGPVTDLSLQLAKDALPKRKRTR